MILLVRTVGPNYSTNVSSDEISSILCPVQMYDHTSDISCMSYRPGVALHAPCPYVVTLLLN
jgi:hypothetical protein